MLVSTDVLEHIDDVLGTFETMLDSIKIGGEALIGNCFYPVIKCHLPKHFHYRYSFKYVAMTLGLKYGGVIDGAEYVQIYTKHKTQHTNIATKMAMRGGAANVCASKHTKTPKARCQTHTKTTAKIA